MAGVAVIAQGHTYNAADTGTGPIAWLVTVIAVVSGGGLLAGFLTPVAAVGAGLCTVVMVATSIPDAGAVAHWQARLLVAADALALAMLGPGALSIDALLFGRREIVVRDTPPYRGDR